MTADERGPSRRFVALDSWRGIAALGVAFHHVAGDSGLAATRWHDALSLCVDFFFVLSGFVIAGAYGGRLVQGFPIRQFLWLRLGRIYPLHLLMLAIYVVIESTLALTGLSHGGRVPFTGTRDPWALIPTVLLIEAWVMPGQGTWNTQSWSISIELGLYLIWALAWRWIGRWATACAVAIAAALLVVEVVRPELIGNQFWAMRGFAGFGLGMGAWDIYRRASASGLALSTGWVTGLEVVTLLAIATVLQGSGSLVLGDALFVALVLIFASERGLVARLLLRGPFVQLGTISYSLYMVHGFVIGRAIDVLALVQRLTGAPLTGDTGQGTLKLLTPAWLTNVLTLALLLLAICAALVTWRWIEEPCRLWSRRRAEA